ncbi:nipped-B protein [Onthophagus taurus]|uniref:nipped-B protein n=1 Tax=Onthophagus taurus TaxID=166361 RepID=UPI000C205D73|nr:nipped-B-like protein A [Onthophagus taurus]
MDREIPSVPITTLAGVTSLSDLLPEMPLPTPLPQTLSNKSLLFHPRVAEEALNLLGVRDETLVPQLVQSLVQTSAEHIEIKDNYATTQPPVYQQEGIPELLRAMIDTNPNLFNGIGKATSQWNRPANHHQSAAVHCDTPQPTNVTLPKTGQMLITGNQRLSTAPEQLQPLPQKVPNSTHISKEENFQQIYSHETNTTELRQLRRPMRGPSPAQASDAPSQSPVPPTETHNTRSKTNKDETLNETTKKEPSPAKETPNETAQRSRSNSTETARDKDKDTLPPGVMLPIVRLQRISTEDQQLMQLSLSDFAENRPKLAKELGILPIANNAAGDYYADKFSELVGNKRRWREDKSEQVVVKPKLRRVKKKYVPVLEKLSGEELMETNTFDRFNRNLEHVLKSSEGFDYAEITDDGVVPAEYLLSRHTLQELTTESAKLKILGATEMIPAEKLVQLLNVLEINIRGGDRVTPITDEENERVRQIWVETAMERIMGAADACLIILYVLTSPNMPKRVYIEDVIERVVLFIKYHMQNTIFPSYDSTYRLDNKKKDGRKKKAIHVLEKSVTGLYSKISVLINLLSELLNIQILTDTSVLHASSMGVSPFFAENVNEIQLASLKLVTTIFTKYESHRRLLLDDILASIARLPSNKRSLRTYRLNSEEHIQMLTALVLQLIQCVVALPENLNNKTRSIGDTTQNENVKNVDLDVLICNKYEKATSTAATFLTVFLSKCGNRSEDIDYRPLFENFIQDLLSTVNKPEWPATELLLSILGKMLMKNFTNKGTDMSLRVASLDYLGVVAARLRRDSVVSHYKLNTIDQMIKEIKSEEMKDNDRDDDDDVDDDDDTDDVDANKKSVSNPDEERTQFLQRVLLDFLAVNAQNEEAHRYARHFYIAQWYKEVVNEKSQLATGEKNNKRTGSKENHKNRSRVISDDEHSSDEEKHRKNEKMSRDQSNVEKFRLLEERKKFLLTKIRPFQEKMSAGNRIQVFQTYIDYNSAELIAQFLASKRYFSQSFDVYLRAILIVLRETSIAIRTKALKCLTMIVEADPAVLGRHDMQMSVNGSLLDHSTSVREAAVDLVGKFVLSRPELINKYYEMLSARILDTGVSVRKRVIKILKDICIECPEFPKIPEICVKLIRRVNDEEGIRKLVMEVFQNMWFTPNKSTPLIRKVMNITDVVASSKDIGLEWFEQLLISLFKPKEDKDDSTKIQVEPPRALLLACKQIVDCLIENILRLEETNDNNTASQRLVACLATLYLFAKIRPQLLVAHALTLQPYLSLKCQSKGETQIICNVARMLELVVPLMEHPSESFLAQLEEDLMKLVIQHDRTIVSSSISCLGSIVNNTTRNYKLIRECFDKYYTYLLRYKSRLEVHANDPAIKNNICRQYFRRALFIVGLLLRHFDFRDSEVIGDLSPDIKDQVFKTMSFFLLQQEFDIQANTLKSIGSICIRHYEFMLEPELKSFYHKMLTSDDVPLKMKSEVLINIENYLLEEDKRMIQQDLEWAKRSKGENLKEMGDVSSGMASTVIQLYLKEILQSYLHPALGVRQPALRVIQLILQQGLVHPVQIVPYLICMTTDCEKVVSHSADKLLLEIEKKYPGFIHTKSSLGVRLSYQLQLIFQSSDIIRGFVVKVQGEYPTALNTYLYSILRNSRQQRRALVLNILKQFDDQARTSLSYMLYLADNLAYFPYLVQDEPLFIVHHIDIMISVSGTNLLQTFREGLMMPENQKLASDNNPEVNIAISALDEDDDDPEALVERVPEDTSQLQACITAAQGCFLLLMLKQQLKDVYGLSDGKIQQYTPSEPAKVYEKTASRRNNALFNPTMTLNKLKEGAPSEFLDQEGRKDLIKQYLEFKQLMLQLDPDDPDDEEGNKALTALSTAGTGANSLSMNASSATVLSDADKVALTNYKDNLPPKVPKLVISNRRLDGEHKRTPRQKPEKKKHRHKKKRRKFVSSSGDESENDYSDPDYMA